MLENCSNHGVTFNIRGMPAEPPTKSSKGDWLPYSPEPIHQARHWAGVNALVALHYHRPVLPEALAQQEGGGGAGVGLLRDFNQLPMPTMQLVRFNFLREMCAC